jgi:hypothetical protein
MKRRELGMKSSRPKFLTARGGSKGHLLLAMGCFPFAIGDDNTKAQMSNHQ